MNVQCARMFVFLAGLSLVWAEAPDTDEARIFRCATTEEVHQALAVVRAGDAIVLEGAYHGNTQTLVDLSPYKHAGPGGAGSTPSSFEVQAPPERRAATFSSTSRVRSMSAG